MMMRALAVGLTAVLCMGAAQAADYSGAHPAPPPDYEPQPIPMFIGPGYYYQQVSSIPPGARFRFVTCEYKGPWCQVEYGRYNGWIDNGDFRTHFDKWWLLGH